MTSDRETGREEHCEHWDHHQRTSNSPTGEGITVEQWRCGECGMEWSVRRRSTTGEELAVESDELQQALGELREALVESVRPQDVWLYLLCVGAGMAAGAVLIGVGAAPVYEIIASGLGIVATAIGFSILYPALEDWADV